MNNLPIGVFDSGVGGLTAVKELRKILPKEEIIYFGDTGRVPYGTRSKGTIKKYAAQAIKYLASIGVKAIVVACGTVSSNFLQEDYDKLGLDIPYIRVVQPAAAEAVAASRSDTIGVLATKASIDSGAYTEQIHRYNSSKLVESSAASVLIPMVESGIIDKSQPMVQAALDYYLKDIKALKADSIILGCTHFPLLAPAIEEYLGYPVTLIDSGAAAARQLKTLLEETGQLTSDNNGKESYYVTDSKEGFVSVAKIFLSEDISKDVHYVDLETIDVGKD